MSVTQITDHSDHETIALLELLLQRAQAGRLPAIACVFKTGPRRHRLAIAGDYWRDPLEVLGGVTRLEYKINQIINERTAAGPETRTMPL